MRNYKFPITRNRGYRRPKDGATSPSSKEKTICFIHDESSLLPAVSQAISHADTQSNRREKPTIESNDASKSRNQSCSKPAKPNCYKCVHRGGVPGSAHSSCNHPVNGNPPMIESMMAIFASVGRVAPVIGGSAKELNIKGNPHGIRSGWFNWPYNFDPVWLETCDGFTPIPPKSPPETIK